MKMTLKAKATRLTKIRFDWTVLFCLFILVAAPGSSYFWYLLPVSISFLAQTIGPISFVLAAMSASAVLTSPLWLKVDFSSLDLLGIVILFSMGIVLHKLRQSKRNFMTLLPWVFGANAIFVGILTLATALKSTSWDYLSWAAFQMNSEIFPSFFRSSHYPETIRYVFDEFTGPILRAGLLGWFVALMTTAFVINGLTESLLKSFRAAHIRGQAKVFERFNRWRATEFTLIPAALGVALLAFDYSADSGSLLWRQLTGWNLVIVGFLPLFLQGLAVVAFLLPRVNIIALIGIVFLLFFNPIPVLVLAGFVELWFDLRSKIDKMPPPDETGI